MALLARRYARNLTRPNNFATPWSALSIERPLKGEDRSPEETSLLDFAKRGAEKQWEVSLLSPDFYNSVRLAHHESSLMLQEKDSVPPERLLQAIWNHQRLVRDKLETIQGEPVRILHPGFWNNGPGPDFTDAVIQIGSQAARSGDIEIDLSIHGWRGHGHDRNPSYDKVMLHVVWERPPKSGSRLPVICIAQALDSPLDELLYWLGTENFQDWPECLKGQCSAPLKHMEEPELRHLLNQAALVRLHQKAADIQARAKQAGAEQAFWEFLFRALGYKQNVWPMQKLAEHLPTIAPRGSTPVQVQARLLGLAGLLPSELTRSGRVNEYLRSLWDVWWRERDVFESLVFPSSVWNFSAVRPANHPVRRLAVAAHWLTDPEFIPQLEKWFWRDDVTQAPGTLSEMLNGWSDPFWSRQHGFGTTRHATRMAFIGTPRIADVVMNAVLPWFWMRSKTGKSKRGQLRAEQLFLKWPKAEDNTVLRLARRRLWGTHKNLPIFTTAASQQGLLQIVRDFCSRTDSLCSACKFPVLIQNWKAENNATPEA